MFSMPPMTQALIIANALAFLLQNGVGDDLIAPLALWPIGSAFMPWQIVTYAFLHGSITHVLFNMFGVYMFGSDLERVWGSRRFLVYYTICVISAAVAQLIVAAVTGAVYPTIGASGGVFGILLAFAMVFPRRMIMPLIPPIPMRAPIFVAIYGALELFLGVTGTQAGVAHFAHLGGMAGGYLWMKLGNRVRQ
jgi:membrane associated rhomboid family serine protease